MRYRVITKMMPAFFLSAALAQAQSPAPSQKEQQIQDLQQQLQQQVQRGGGRGAVPGGGSSPLRAYFGYVGNFFNPGAWWTNANLVAQMSLTEDQKSKIERIYANHKQAIASDSDAVTRQEAQLQTLLAAEPVDHNAVMRQIDRVAQARADLERSNSAMTLEMREVLTAAQWAKLLAQPSWLDGTIGARLRYFPSVGQRGQRQQ